MKSLFFVFSLVALFNQNSRAQDSIAGVYSSASVRTFECGYDPKSGTHYIDGLVMPDTTKVSVYTLKADGTFIRLEWGSSTYSFEGMKDRGKTFELTGTWKIVDGVVLIIFERERIYEDRKRLVLAADHDLTKRLMGADSDPKKMYKDILWPARHRTYKLNANGDFCELTYSEGTYCYSKIIN